MVKARVDREFGVNAEQYDPEMRRQGGGALGHEAEIRQPDRAS